MKKPGVITHIDESRSDAISEEAEYRTPRHKQMMAKWKRRARKEELLERLEINGEADSSVRAFSGLDEPMIPRETYEEYRLRVNLEGIRDMLARPRRERQRLLGERSKAMVGVDEKEEMKRTIEFEFQQKIDWETAFPTHTINKLILLNIKRTEDRLKNDYTSEKLAEKFAQDPVINGLCILRCLKADLTEEYDFKGVEPSRLNR